MRERTFSPAPEVWRRVRFLCHLMLIAGALIVAILGLQMGHLPWIFGGLTAFGVAATLRRHVYERWRYREIEEALDQIHSSGEALDGEAQLREWLAELDSETVPVWERPELRKKIRTLLSQNPALAERWDEKLRARHPDPF